VTTDVAVGGDSYLVAVDFAPEALVPSRTSPTATPPNTKQRFRPVHFAAADIESAAVERA
jgi:hypothetical protein